MTGGGCPAPRLPSKGPDGEMDSGFASVCGVTLGPSRRPLDLDFPLWNLEVLNLPPLPFLTSEGGVGMEGRGAWGAMQG